MHKKYRLFILSLGFLWVSCSEIAPTQKKSTRGSRLSSDLLESIGGSDQIVQSNFGENAHSKPSPKKEDIDKALLALGTSTYEKKCASCHSELRVSAVYGAKKEEIEAAINSIDAMKAIKITADELEALAHVLNPQIDSNNDEDPPNPADLIPPEEKKELLLGAELYGSQCASCHGPLTNSGKKGASQSDIEMAINNIDVMKDIQLNSDQVRSIEKILEKPEIILILTAEAPLDAYLPLGTRKYISSLLKTVFGGQDQALVDQIVDTNITNRFFAFGGICILHEENCQVTSYSKQEEQIKALMHPMANTTRSAYLQRSCELLVAQDKIQSNLLTNAGISSTSLVNGQNIDKIQDLFFPGTPIDADLKAAVLNFADELQNLGVTTEKEKWKYVSISFCSSPLIGAL